MSKLNLPTSGATNWGSGLNSYIRHLENRVSTLESNYGDMSINSVVDNVAGACSGVISNFNIVTSTMDKNTTRIRFFGLLYFAGEIRKIIEVETSSPIEYQFTSDLTTPNMSYFVYLHYNSALGGATEKEKLEILVEPELKLNYKQILIGFYYNGKFVPYYQWDLKTVMQHQYEVMNPYTVMDEYAVSINVGEGKPSVNLSTNPISVYCGGCGWATGGTNLNINATAEITPIQVNVSDINYFLEDNIDEDTNLITTDFKNLVEPTCHENSNVYRILVDIFGNLFIQLAEADDVSFKVDKTYAEQYLLNTRFGREFYKKDNADKYVYSLQANLMMEVGRFGFVGSATGIYNNLANAGSSIRNDIVYVRSLKDGVATQPFQNIWITDDSHLIMDKIELYTDSADVDYFKLSHSHSTTGLSITMDKLIKNYRYYPLTIAKSGERYIITWNENVKRVILQSSSDEYRYELGDQPLLEDNYFYDSYEDSYYKFNFETIDKKIYLTLFAEDSSGDREMNMVILQELSLVGYDIFNSTINFNENYIIDDRPNVLFNRTNAINDPIVLRSSNIHLGNSISSIDLTSNTFQFISEGRSILSNDNDDGTILNIYSNVLEDYYNLELSYTTLENKTTYNTYYNSISSIWHTVPDKNNTDILEFNYLSHSLSLIDEKYQSLITLTADKILSNGNLEIAEDKQILVTSDRRRKEGFAPVEEKYLPIVCSVPVLNYHYKNSEKQQVGIIAQDLENVLFKNIDCFVTKQDTAELKDKRSLNESKLIFILWKALQEEVEARKKLETYLMNLEK